MTSLFFNFVKRAIIFPLAAVVIVCLFLNFFVTRQIDDAGYTNVSNSVEVNIDDYSPKEYNTFDELKAGRYAMTLNYGNVESAVLYESVEEQSDISNLFYINTTSTEPWNNGCVKIISDSWYQINKLLDIRVGDVIEGDFYHGNDAEETDISVYKYRVTGIMNSRSARSISKFNEADTMLICASYDNIADKNQKNYYVIVAEREV